MLRPYCSLGVLSHRTTTNKSKRGFNSFFRHIAGFGWGFSGGFGGGWEIFFRVFWFFSFFFVGWFGLVLEGFWEVFLGFFC